MGMLDQLLGGDAAERFGSLIQQFEGGTAHEVSHEDAAAHHDEIAKHLSKDDYAQAAQEAAQKLTPEQRKELGPKLAEAAKAQGHDVDKTLAPHGGDPTSSQAIGKLLSALQGNPGGIGALVSSGGLQSLAGNAAFRSALVGVAAMAAKRLL
jgi:hypothetical protein